LFYEIDFTIVLFIKCFVLNIYSHGVAVARGGTEKLVVSFDAGHSSDDFAADFQSQRQRQRRPHYLKQKQCSFL